MAVTLSKQDVETWLRTLPEDEYVGTGNQSTGCLGYHYLKAQGVNIRSFFNDHYNEWVPADAEEWQTSMPITVSDPEAVALFNQFDQFFYSRPAYAGRVLEVLFPEGGQN